MKMKLIITRKVLRLPRFESEGFSEQGNGLFSSILFLLISKRPIKIMQERRQLGTGHHYT